MTLEDLASGRRILASEDRGPHARGCHLNAGALEEAAVLAASSIEPGVDLVVINRFGKQEAEGRGFRQAIEAAILLERPVLVGVSETNRGNSETFTGSEAEYLPCSIDAVLAWYRGVGPDAAQHILDLEIPTNHKSSNTTESAEGQSSSVRNL